MSLSFEQTCVVDWKWKIINSPHDHAYLVQHSVRFLKFKLFLFVKDRRSSVATFYVEKKITFSLFITQYLILNISFKYIIDT